MGLKARIWALRQEFGPQDWNLGLNTGIQWGVDGGGEGGEGKISPMCKSIGQQTL